MDQLQPRCWYIGSGVFALINFSGLIYLYSKYTPQKNHSLEDQLLWVIQSTFCEENCGRFYWTPKNEMPGGCCQNFPPKILPAFWELCVSFFLGCESFAIFQGYFFGSPFIHGYPGVHNLWAPGLRTAFDSK